jgi:CSLREA domain-containing protein
MNHRKNTLIGTTILVSSICLSLISPFPVAGSSRLAVGATITVNTTTDEYNTGASCSLREAVRAAELNTTFGGCTTGGSGTDTILLSAVTYLLTLPYSGNPAQPDREFGDIDVDSNILIQGAGQDTSIIDAAGLGDRIFEVADNISMELNDLTLTRGTAQDGADGTGGASGTGGSHGGAIYARVSTTLTLAHVTISQNHSGQGGNGSVAITPGSGGGHGGGGGNGGGISQYYGTLTINDSNFWENYAGSAGSGGAGASGNPGGSGGGGGYGATAGYGGAIYMYGGTMTIMNTNFTDNGAGSGGNGGNGAAGGSGSTPGGTGGQGGIGGTAGNGGEGGAIYTESATVIENSTFTGNNSGNAGSGGVGGKGGNGGAGGDGNPATAGGNGGNGGTGGSPLTAGGGGAVSSRNAVLEIHGCEFNGNGTGTGSAGGSGGDGGAGGAGGSSTSVGVVGANGGNGGLGGGATGQATGGDGGAIRHRNFTLVVENSTFSYNFTGYGRPGGSSGYGGAGGNGGSGLSAAGGNGGTGGNTNSGGYGGIGGSGGALSLESSAAATLINVTISGNSTGTSPGGGAGGDGGNGGNGGSGVPTGNGGNGGYASVGGNGGASGSGAGISMPYYGSGTHLVIYFNTIVQNTIAIPTGSGGIGGTGGSGGSGTVPGTTGASGIAGSGSLFGYGGGIYRETPSATVLIGSTILADNLAGTNYINCYSRSNVDYTSVGWNLIGNTSGCPIAYAEDDQTGVTTVLLALGPLQVNLANPPTHALLPDSIALNYVQGGEAGCDDFILTDARGYKRPVGGGVTPCDVGAYEAQFRGFLPFLKK